MGSLLVLPPDLRRVPIADGFRAHLDAAATLDFPMDARLRASALPDDAQCAVATAVAHGPHLADARRAAVAALTPIASAWRPISARVNHRLMPATVYRIAARVNTVAMAIVIDALGWIDTTLVAGFIFGFPVVGDIPDSGVYRPIEPSASPPEHLAMLAAFNSTISVWNRHLHQRLTARRWGSDAERAADTAVAAKTAKEVSKGLVVGPYLSPAALHDAVSRLWPQHPRAETEPRILNRFGVLQKGDIRAIDDAKSNGATRATRLVETVTTPHFYFPAVVARAAATASGCAVGLACISMVVTLLDLSAAYRTVPTSQPWHTSVGFYNPLTERAEYYWLPGHNFGHASAVVNFNRYPEFVVVAARALLFAPCNHYYDDFICGDPAAGDQTAREAIDAIVLMAGPGTPRRPHEAIRSPEIDPAKTQAAAPSNVVLGVVADLSLSDDPRPRARFWVDPERARLVLAEFRAAFARGVLTPHEASRLRGKLFFLLSAAFGMVGRAATLPLVQRQYRDTSTSFVAGSELHECLLFFEALLPALPELVLDLLPARDPPLLVYTDASFWRTKRRAREGRCSTAYSRLRGALGAVVYDPLDGTVRSASAEPDWAVLLSSWRTDRRTYIAELELLAAIAVYTTYPELFAGRKVNHFIDNTVALSALVHGYSGKPDLAKGVNVFFLQMVALRASIYLDWVPSKANIADLPSRGEFAALRAALRGIAGSDAPSDPLVPPSLASWRAPLASWAAVRPEAARARIPG